MRQKCVVCHIFRRASLARLLGWSPHIDGEDGQGVEADAGVDGVTHRGGLQHRDLIALPSCRIERRAGDGMMARAAVIARGVIMAVMLVAIVIVLNFAELAV